MALHPLHFFKVIVHRNLQDKKLMIPKKFTDEYGQFLSSFVCLKLPDGSEWKIGLTTSTNRTVWLHKNWHRFSEHYGLKFGSFLVFRFDGNSNFHTIIFDTIGSEIEYYCRNFIDSKKEEDDENPSFILPVPKKMRNEGSFSPKIEPEEARDHGRPHNASNSEEHVGSRGPFFERTMKSLSNRVIYIPRNVVRDSNILMMKNIVIRDEMGKLWATSTCHNSQNRISITTGWSKFYQGHNLRENDKCEFEFVLDWGNVCRQFNVKVTRACR